MLLHMELKEFMTQKSKKSCGSLLQWIQRWETRDLFTDVILREPHYVTIS